MKAQSTSSASPPPGRPCVRIKLLMVYEDLDTGNRVLRAVDALQHRCGKEVFLQSEMWKSEILGCSSMGQMAAEAAAEADLVIVSAHGAQPLPDEVSVWFQAWVNRRKSRPAALVALLNNSHAGFGVSDEPRGFLQQMAHDGQMDFFTILTEEEESDLPGRREANRDEQPPPVLEWL